MAISEVDFRTADADTKDRDDGTRFFDSRGRIWRVVGIVIGKIPRSMFVKCERGDAVHICWHDGQIEKWEGGPIRELNSSEAFAFRLSGVRERTHE